MERMWIDWAIPRITDAAPHPSPYLGSDDANERNLAKWVKMLRSKMRRGTISEDQKEKLEQLPGWSWGKNHDDEFQRKVRRWGMWYHVHRREPKIAKNSTEEEKCLQRWQSRIQQLHRKGKLPPYHFAVLNHMQGWQWKTKTTKSFDEWVDEWKEFASTHQRIPHADANDTDEASLGKWRKQTLKTRSKLTKAREELLSNLPLWSWNNEDELFEMARRWTRWVQVNEGVFPSPHSTSNPTEAKLGAWAHDLRGALQHEMYPPIVVEKLTKISQLNKFLQQV